MTNSPQRRSKFLSMIAMAAGATALMASAFISTVGATPPTDLHCPDKDHPDKVESAESDGSVVLDAGTVFCAKKKEGNTGSITADGVTSIYEYLVAAGIDGEPGEGPSYYIVYSTPEETTSTTSSTTTTSTTTSSTTSTTTTTEPEVTTTTTEPPVTTTTVAETTTTVPEVTTTVPPTTEPPVITEPPVTEPPTTQAPITLPTVPQTQPEPVPDKVAVDTVARPPVVVNDQLARTGANDMVPVLTLIGVGLLVSGVLLSRRAARI